MFLQHGCELDERIEHLKKYDSPNEMNLEEVSSTHKWLTNIFCEITDLEKRSLASKYLHFHYPHLFYIYDSRSNKA